MRIATYDEVDPAGVLDLNLTSLGYPLTPERVADIRRLDPRPAPYFALYAVDKDVVAAQVGVFRLPVVTTDGSEEVGGLWAVCTHPRLSRRGLASLLIDEAHRRMRASGLRLSTLGTSRHLAAHHVYRRHGYVDSHTANWVTIDAPVALQARRLTASPTAADGWEVIDRLFNRLSEGYLGFSRRHPRFLAAMAAADDLGRDDVWLIREAGEDVGYAVATQSASILTVKTLLVGPDVEPADAIAALTQEVGPGYLRVRIDLERVAVSLQQAGYPPAHAGWGSFMVKPLDPALAADEAAMLLGMGTERFMISPLDIT